VLFLGFGVNGFSRVLDILLWSIMTIGSVIPLLMAELPRFIPPDLKVRWFFPATRMEVLQLSKRQEKAADTLMVAHLSDLHLTEDLTIEGGLDQQPVRELAFRAIKWALQRSEFVILTGDITDRGRPSEWDQFLGILEQLNVPLASNRVLFVPGNHDLSMTTTETFSPYLAFEKARVHVRTPDVAKSSSDMDDGRQ
jgi:predicted MPP superfamily phosphohydrolase